MEVGVVSIAEEVEEVFVLEALDSGELEFEEVALAVSAGSRRVGKELSEGRGNIPRVHVGVARTLFEVDEDSMHIPHSSR
jgi:hypothetical protein